MFVAQESSPASTPPKGADPIAEISLERLEHEIVELASHIYAGTCRWLELVAEFDRREGLTTWGCRSSAEWVAWRCGVAPRAAREHVRVARRLAELPSIHDAFGNGELSYSKVRALTRVADAASEEDLLELARHATAAQLDRIVRGMRRVSAYESQQTYDERYLSWWWERDGSLGFHGSLPGEEGALFLRALDAGRDELRRGAWAAERPGDGGPAGPASARPAAEEGLPAGELLDGRTAEINRAALGGSAEPLRRPEDVNHGSPEPFGGTEGVNHGSAEPLVRTEDVKHGSAEPAPTARRVTNADALVAIAESSLASASRERVAGERYQVIVHTDSSTLSSGGSLGTPPESGATPDPDSAQLEDEDGPALAAETARRLACDASIVSMDDPASTWAAGRKTRGVPSATRRALRARDGGCRFPGCESRRFVDAHHIHHWAHGGETKLDNLVQLCGHHHRLVHEGGFVVEPVTGGRVRFRRPDGTVVRVVPHRPRSAAESLTRVNNGRGLAIDAATLSPGSCETFAVSDAVDALVVRAPPG